MKQPAQATTANQKAFTLIELLVVIAIIGVLAAMIFPITAAIKTKQIKSVAGAQLIQLETAIEAYKSKVGFYPPDNPNDPLINPLYFELKGTLSTPQFPKPNPGEQQPYFVTLDQHGEIAASGVKGVFGVDGFVNTGTSANGTDDAPAPVDFLKELKPNQYGALDTSKYPNVMLLACSINWPDTLNPQPVPGNPGLNPWRYVSSHPKNNPNSYDLWVDVVIHGKTNRISNWTSEAQVLP